MSVAPTARASSPRADLPESSFLARSKPALLACLISGLAQVAIFPRLQLSWLALVCFVPLLILIPYQRSSRLFLYFFLSGTLFHLGNLYWIVHVIQHYTTLNTLLSVGVVLLLCLVLSLLWGLFGLLLQMFALRTGFITSMILAPSLWIFLEWSRNPLTHFPWCLLGYSQYSHLRLAQVASLFGVYGLSWLLMAANASLSVFIVRRKYHYMIATLVLLLLSIGYGHYRIGRPIEGESLKVGCIQGNVPQDVKLNYEFADEINLRHLQMTKELIDRYHPDLVFWSESSTLFQLRNGADWTAQILNLAKQTATPLVIGSDHLQGDQIYNSAFFVNAKGEIGSDYDKMYLVPFGEFVPLKSILFFAGKVVPEISDFSPGQDYTSFAVDEQKFGIHICFEVVFPQLSRAFCRNGATFLATITNDAWFGKTCASYQHFAMAVMRAIENRRYLVRCANTGISGFVDPYGRILQATNLYVPAKIVGDVKGIQEQTFYTKHGDILVYASGVICVAAFGLSFRRKKKEAIL